MRDPLVALLKKVRERHGVTQAKLDEYMGLPPGTYRHIERERRPLPDYRGDLVDWIRQFEDCVQATREERKEILQVMSQQVLAEFDKLLRDLEDEE